MRGEMLGIVLVWLTTLRALRHHAGPERRKAVISDKDRKLTAYHEAGAGAHLVDRRIRFFLVYI